MTAGLVFLHIGLALTAFLIVLNGYLRGSKKAQIDAALSLLWLVLLGVTFVAFGWKAGLLAIILSFVYALVSKPIARSMARRLLGYRTAIESAGFKKFDLSVEGVLREGEETDRRLSQISRKADIARVLEENGMTPDDLREHYWFLMAAGMGTLSWEIVSTPEDLRLLLKLRKQGLSPLEIAAKLLAR